tara:strand:+ start:221 stop:901 length:681 start_codon:yes stop_codon:yes gene_type:complete
MDKIAFCVPSTSRNRDWKDIEDSYLLTILLPSIKLQQTITLYVGYDFDDVIYSKKENRIEHYNDIEIIWKEFYGAKGNPCGVWTELTKIAITDGFEYVFICGDDIALDKRHEWMGVFLKALKKNNNIGYSAGWSNNNQIPTQFLIHKTHLNIFGWVFPPQIRNWQCDDFLFHLYGDKYGNWLQQYRHLNVGGEPRYKPDNCINLRELLVKKYKKVLKSYVDKNGLK